MTYELHPLCTLFPRVEGAEFDALVADIGANGLRNPIVLHNNMVLDGGNRYRACLKAGVEPTFIEFSGESVVAFVLSANLHRRHLTPGQQAAIVASAQDWAQAHGRGGDRKSDQSATLHFDSAERRAAESGASLRTQKMADKVVKADPELAKKVAQGEVSLPQAVAKVDGKEPKRVKRQPEPVPEYADADEYGPSEEEIRESLEFQEAMRRDTEKIIASDDKLATAYAIIEQQRAQIEQLRWQIQGLQNERNDMIRRVKAANSRAEKAERTLQ